MFAKRDIYIYIYISKQKNSIEDGKKSTIRNLLLLSLHHQPDSGVGEK